MRAGCPNRGKLAGDRTDSHSHDHCGDEHERESAANRIWLATIALASKPLA